MPNQMPPTAFMAGLCVSTMIMSRPGPIAFGRTPSTSMSNCSGVVPSDTVQPSPTMPFVTLAVGRMDGHSPGAAAAGAATASAPTTVSRASFALVLQDVLTAPPSWDPALDYGPQRFEFLGSFGRSDAIDVRSKGAEPQEALVVAHGGVRGRVDGRTKSQAPARRRSWRPVRVARGKCPRTPPCRRRRCRPGRGSARARLASWPTLRSRRGAGRRCRA